MVNNMCSIYREKKEVKKKSGKGSNGHMTVGKGEIENREYYRWERGWGVFHQRSVGKEGGPVGGGGEC